ncbi:MAG: Na(+)-translocating NADH-quinone reductase subunit A [Thermodesulfobacteriota bacterium]
MITIKKGFDLSISGAPEQAVGEGPLPGSVALLGPDYPDLQAALAVAENDYVRVGQLLFEDKKRPGVKFTAPAAGTVSSIQWGAKKELLAVVIKVQGDESVPFASYMGRKIERLSVAEVTELLLESGLWTALRTRPFSKTPLPGSEPHSIFVTAMDTNPLAPCVETVLHNYGAGFDQGLKILKKLTRGPLFLCKAPGTVLSGSDLPEVSTREFAGPHPAGLAGTHINFLDPVGMEKTVWSIGYQDVAAIGHLFSSGELLTQRVISLAGPQVQQPRLLRARLGASIADLTEGELKAGENRLISGSILGGRLAQGALAYLGRFHNQVSVLREGRERKLFGWALPGRAKFFVKPAFLSPLWPAKSFALTTAVNGSKRPLIPIGRFEKVMPLDTEPTFLLRALLLQDMEQAKALGCLGLDEEDLALATFVDLCKNDFGPLLRQSLRRIEKKG